MANGQQIEGLPAGATLKPIEGLPAGAELRPIGDSTPPDTRNSFQQGVDALTETEPANKRPGVGGALTTAASNIGAGFMSPLSMVAHPIATAKGIGRSIANPYDPQGALSGMASGLKENPVGTLETLPGQAAAAAVPGLLKAGGSALRSAAIGDPDAAALRGLQIGPKSDAQLSTLKSVGQARPYLKGATSQADMQGRIKPAMNEVWNPYQTAVENIGDRPVKGPDGMTTVRELEAERQRLSALNRDVKAGVPSAIQQVMQEGRTPAQLIQRESDVQTALDPHLASTGIKPEAVRGTYGALADVRSGVEGKTTLNEKPKPSGFGRMLNIKPLNPRSYIGEPAQGVRDIVAGRPLWSAKPTDLGIKEGFATGGPKPDLGKLTAPNLAAARPMGLPAPAPQFPLPKEPSGTPADFRPPPFYADTTAMRTGRLLPAPPIELGGRVEGPMTQPFYHDTSPMRTGRILPEGAKPPIQLEGRSEGIRTSPFRYDTTPMRKGRLLPEPSQDVPLSSHTDIFPEQRPGSAIVKKGKK